MKKEKINENRKRHSSISYMTRRALLSRYQLILLELNNKWDRLLDDIDQALHIRNQIVMSNFVFRICDGISSRVG